MGAVPRQGRPRTEGCRVSRHSEDDEGGGRLSGWSRRKLAALRGEVDPKDVSDGGLDGKAEEPIVAPEDVDAVHIAALPPVETIGAGSDIKPFLARGVPANLKNAALRRLWSATPGVRDHSDPAVDYAWDWNAPGGVPGGGGMLSESGVAKMVKDLNGEARTGEADREGSPDATDKQGTETDAGRPEAAPSNTAPETEAPPVAIRRTEKRDVQTIGDKADRPDEARRAVASIAPPRRHGGAVPE